MPKARVVVTDAQVEAARMIVDHDKALGRETSAAIRKIAEAVPQVAPADSARRRKLPPARSHRAGRRPATPAPWPSAPAGAVRGLALVSGANTPSTAATPSTPAATPNAEEYEATSTR